MSEYYYRVLGEEFGPISIELLQQKIAAGQLSDSNEFRIHDDPRWTPIAQFSAPRSNHHHTVANADPATAAMDQGIYRVSDQAGEPLILIDASLPSRIEGAVADDQRRVSTTMPETAATTSLNEIVNNLPPLVEASSPSAPSPTVAESPRHEHAAQAIAEKPSQPAATVNTLPNEDRWYTRTGQVERGPMNFQKLMDLAAVGFVLPTDRIRQGEKSEWMLAQKIPGLFQGRGGYFGASTSAMGSANRSYILPPSLPPQVQHTTSLPARAVAPPPPPAPSHPLPLAVEKRPVVHQPVMHQKSFVHHHELSPAAIPRNFERTTSFVQHDHPIDTKNGQNGSTTNGIVAPQGPSPEPAPPPVEKPASAESKHKLRRGQFVEFQLLSRRNLIVATIVAGIIAVIVVMNSELTPIRDFGTYCRQLDENYITLSYLYQSKPTVDVWNVLSKDARGRLEGIIQETEKISSRREIRKNLVTSAEFMIRAIEAYNVEDPTESDQVVTANMFESRNFLDLAWSEYAGRLDHDKKKMLKQKKKRIQIEE